MTFNFLSFEDITTALIIYTIIASNNTIHVVKSQNTLILMLKNIEVLCSNGNILLCYYNYDV